MKVIRVFIKIIKINTIIHLHSPFQKNISIGASSYDSFFVAFISPQTILLIFNTNAGSAFTKADSFCPLYGYPLGLISSPPFQMWYNQNKTIGENKYEDC